MEQLEFNNLESIKEIRNSLGLGRTEFANLLGMNSTGERTVRGWENGEHSPSKKKLEDIKNLRKTLEIQKNNAPFARKKKHVKKFTFIDLFAGIGGIRLAFQRLKGDCVFSSEWDKFAQKTYAENFGEIPKGDITKIKNSEIPDHDILLGGFPCQAFSQAGLKKGFKDTRGTMFFEIQRIISEKRPKAFMLENVKQLKSHGEGQTLETILSILRGTYKQEIANDIEIGKYSRKALSKKLNYWVDYKVLRAGDFGVPQNRERIFIVGFNKDYYKEDTNYEKLFEWPKPKKIKTRVGNILENLTSLSIKNDTFTISNKLWAGHKRRKTQHANKGNGFGYTLFNKNSEYTNTISARYYKDGSEILIDQSELGKNPRKLTPRECARLQGFPENFIVNGVSQCQIYKQFGNSVCINVVESVAKQMIKAIKKFDRKLIK